VFFVFFVAFVVHVAFQEKQPVKRFGLLTRLVVLLMLLAACTGTQTADVIEPSSGGSSQTGTGSMPAPSEPATPTPSGVPAPEASTEGINPLADPGLNLLVSSSGGVQLKRKTWSSYTIVDFGSELYRGDLIRVSSGGNALVLCDGLTTWEVPSGAPAGLNHGCPPPPEAVLIRGASLVGNTRAISDPLIPYIISPRKTKLLNTMPVLRWNPSPDAANYTVSVRGQTFEWSATTDVAEFVYGGDPALIPGQTYILIVEADNGKSSQDEGTPGLGFTLLDDATASQVQRAIDKIKSLKLSAEAEALALSQFMVGQGLFSEAIELLEGVSAGGRQASSVYRRLGDLYRASGLNLIADERYARAVELADSVGNLESASAARAGWAEVHITLGNQDEAIHLFEEAIVGYETLGDAVQVDTLKQRLAAISG
jgi:hypothetical protein